MQRGWLKNNWVTIIAELRKLYIKNECGEIVRFEPNQQQWRVLRYVYAQIEAGVPVYVIVLKNRKVGVSTLVAALIYVLCKLAPHTGAYILSATKKLTGILNDIVSVFKLNDPDKLIFAKDNTEELKWGDAHGSQISFDTAGAKIGVRGPTPQIALLSELAQVDNAKEALSGIMGAIPKNNPDTMVFIESTAQGAAGEFYERWTEGVKRLQRNPNNLDGIFPVFLAFQDDAKCQTPVPEGYAWGELSKQELELKGLGLKDEQLYWRRLVLAKDFNGDEDQFCQENPSTWQEAFLRSGRPAVPGIVRGYHGRLAAKAVPHYVLLQWNDLGKNGVRAYHLDEPQAACWKVFHAPENGVKYCLGVDVAEGKLSNFRDSKSDTDRSAGVVLNRMKLRTDATFVSRLETEPWGEEVVKAGLYFNKALVVPDTTGLGIAVLNVLERHHYYNILERMDQTDKMDKTFSERYGYRFTSISRQLLVDDLLRIMRPDYRNMGAAQWEGRLKVLCKDIIAEEETWVFDERGRADHLPGALDDLLIALGLAVQGHLQTPLVIEGYRMGTEAVRTGAYAGEPDGFDDLMEPVRSGAVMRRSRIN